MHIPEELVELGITEEIVLKEKEGYKAAALNTENILPWKARKALRRYVAEVELPEPRIICLPSPRQCLFAIEYLEKPEYAYLEEESDAEIERVMTELYQEIYPEDVIQVEPHVYSGMEMWWMCSYEFTRKYLSKKVKFDEADSRKYDAYLDVVKECGLVYMYHNFHFISDRPSEINQDEDQELHCEDGPAIKYGDGSGCYIWHGQRVPKHWIMEKDKVPAKEVLAEPNLETRRCGCEIIGWVKILKELNAETLDKNPDPEIGELMLVDFPGQGKGEIIKLKLLKVRCDTGRDFALVVDNPDVKTALEANAWTYSMTVEEFLSMEVRT